MDRSEVVAAFFQPPPSPLPVPAPTADPSPARRLRDAIEPLAMHSVWSAGTGSAMEALGLDLFGAYVGARAALLGDCHPCVAVSAFAVFEPGLLRGVLSNARAACDPSELLSVRDAATISSLRAVLADVDPGLVGDAAERMRAAVTGADATARPLFSGVLELGWPGDPVGVLWRACEAAREHRGDDHVAVSVAAGLGALRMNLLTEAWLGMPLGPYTATRGWGPDAIAAEVAALRAEGLLDGDLPSERGLALRAGIEDATDALEEPIVAALGDDGERDELVERLEDWSRRCIEAQAFPTDPFKRAAG